MKKQHFFNRKIEAANHPSSGCPAIAIAFPR
jgi:hypothetical protein